MARRGGSAPGRPALERSAGHAAPAFSAGHAAAFRARVELEDALVGVAQDARLHKIDAVAGGDELREVMRRFPAPVAVVTTRFEDERYGFTAGSVVSLSLEPPLVGVSVGRDSSSHEPMRRAGAFAISLLSEQQTAVAQHFARSGIPPVVLWEGTHVRESDRGPLVEDALAWLECNTWAQYDAGDHTLFVGEVVSLELGKVAKGLVYRDSTYHPA